MQTDGINIDDDGSVHTSSMNDAFAVLDQDSDSSDSEMRKKINKKQNKSAKQDPKQHLKQHSLKNDQLQQKRNMNGKNEKDKIDEKQKEQKDDEKKDQNNNNSGQSNRRTSSVANLTNIVSRGLQFANDAKLIVIDFGEAIEIEQGKVYDDICGTLVYMPPEIMRARQWWEMKGHDMWSIGVIAYILGT